MMKKITIGLLVCGVVLSVGSSVNAEGVSTTKAKVEFIQGDTEGEVTPTPNPDPNPEKKPDPDPNPLNPTEPGNKGALKFVDLPQIDFGKVELAPFAQKYYANFEKRQAKTTEGTMVEGLYPTMVGVQDLRGGAKGWNVTVSHNGVFKKIAGDKDSTVNAYLALKDGFVTTKSFDAATDVEKYKPESMVNATEYKEISSENGRSNIEILRAEKGKGYGKWAIGFGRTDVITSGKGLDGNAAEGSVNTSKQGLNPSVRMTVPTQVIDTDEGGNYETTLTWTLNNTL